MVITVIALCLMPVMFVAGFFCAVKALQIGLKWQMQVQKGQTPTATKADIVRDKPQTDQAMDLLRQYLTGESADDGEN